MSQGKTLGFVHTSATLVPMFTELCSKHLPNVDAFHISDDSTIRDVIRQGTLSVATSRRVLDHILAAEAAGADRILVTCSSIGPAVEAAQAFVSVPVIRVDRAMAENAVAIGNRVGIAATLPTTLGPTADLIERCGTQAGKSLELTTELCEGAFDCLMGGEVEEHDARVAQALQRLLDAVDVVVLAQASMARVAQLLPPDADRLPILTSPELAIRALADDWAS